MATRGLPGGAGLGLVGSSSAETLSRPSAGHRCTAPRRLARARDGLRPRDHSRLAPASLRRRAGRQPRMPGAGVNAPARALLDVRRRRPGQLRPRRQPDLDGVRGGARRPGGRRRPGLRLGHGGRRRGPVARPRTAASSWRRARLQRHRRRSCSTLAARRPDRPCGGSTSPTPQPSSPPCDGADLVWLESPTNPMLEVADLPALVAAARERGRDRRSCDNTFATPLRAAAARAGRRRRRALGDQVPRRPLRRHPRRHRHAPTPSRPRRCTSGCQRHRLIHGGASPGRWRPGWPCAACAPCTCGSSGPAPTPPSSRAALAGHPAVRPGPLPRLRRDRRRSRCPAAPTAPSASPPATRLWTHATSLGGVESLIERRRRHAGGAADGAGGPAAALGRHRGRRRPLARPRPGPATLTPTGAPADRPDGSSRPASGRLGLPRPRHQRLDHLGGLAPVVDDAQRRARRSARRRRASRPSCEDRLAGLHALGGLPGDRDDLLDASCPGRGSRRRCGCATAATCRWR